MARDPAEELALWRYHLIAEALHPRLMSRERGLIVRRVADQEHAGPDGLPRRISRTSLDRWIRAYRQHGLAGLRDQPRADLGSTRRRPELIEAAIRLRLEQPARSAAHIVEVLRQLHGVTVAERTLRDQFQKRGLTRAELLRDRRTWGRYEASAPNERWMGDVLVGPWVPFPRAPGSRRARLFLLLDDHSRLHVHGHWYPVETLRAGQEVLYQAILRRGLPVVLRRQRCPLRRPRAAAQLRHPRHPPGPQPTVLAPRSGQARKAGEGDTGAVPSRDRAGRRRQLRGAQRPLRGLVRELPQPPPPFADRRDTDGAVPARPDPACRPRAAAPGLPLVGAPTGQQDRDRQLPGQRVPDRPGAARPRG